MPPKRFKVGGGRHGPSAVGAPPAIDKEKTGDEKGTATFRFWTDARRFKGSEEKCIMQQALFASGGVRTGGYPKAAPVPGPLGCQRPSDWDLLWSPARLALKALPVKPGQLISAMPGMMSVTRKRKLSLTLKEAYGEEAFRIIPRTYSLPDELEAWRQHLRATSCTNTGALQSVDAAGSAEPALCDAQRASDSIEAGTSSSQASTSGSSGLQEQLWILKTAQHLGKGLKLVTPDQAVQEASKNRGRSKADKPYVQAQQYVQNPLLIQGRKFGIRVWVLVTGHDPLRVFMHTNGLVLFSTHQYTSEVWSTDQGEVALGHVTNYAQNQDGMVWNLSQLQSHLGAEVYNTLWERISRNTAWVFSAALPHVQAQHQASGALPGSTFELLGLDYLVDTDLHPWLLEVNGTPSLAVEHENPAVEQLIHEQKMGMVQDMVSVLNVRQRFAPRYAAMRLAMARQGISSAAAADNGNHASSSSECEDCVLEDALSDQASEGAAAAGRRALPDESEDAEGETSTGGSSFANNAVGGYNGVGAAPARGNKAVQSSTARTALLRKRLREQMSPTSNSAVWTRVRQELQHRGNFQPLMSLFPVTHRGSAPVPGPVRAPPAAAGTGISWDARDMDLAVLMATLRQAPSSGAADLAPLSS